jgi:formamidopyrimidine-DNA glycosylase
MPELPEVEVLVRHLSPLLKGKKIRSIDVRRAKILKPTAVAEFQRRLERTTFLEVRRRGKYLLFTLESADGRSQVTLLGHLGMTGRMYLLPSRSVLPKHAAIVVNLGRENFVFEDTRYFGRLTLDTTALERLGPEPLESEFTIEKFAGSLKRSSQSIKIKLLDQSVVAGVGNIYASEALFRAGISPRIAARRLSVEKIADLWRAIREVLLEAIECGSTVPLNYSGADERDGLFYFGTAPDAPDFYEERLRVYGRERQPCLRCGSRIRRLIQAARSTFYCPTCQRTQVTTKSI